MQRRAAVHVVVPGSIHEVRTSLQPSWGDRPRGGPVSPSSPGLWERGNGPDSLCVTNSRWFICLVCCVAAVWAPWVGKGGGRCRARWVVPSVTVSVPAYF
ncbi:hypothetical protein M406DRAFT_358497 [Cryphonectria parasitica EP155]|uniref:Uncharacterized protein n=1 Tax=Cryphonectria parasitica (strain ATCC 38755 / EP155) TaxID=660469 RepID=A0A9P4XTQ6_CRYP1|nr:uncharacterized protein M406DRAFT_358497 [Cryphonectria parasitica EP155]KAF3761154.1 hypothetical protein M406DRAFT_358497 [Cryphonectria parasitica EP155]